LPFPTLVAFIVNLIRRSLQLEISSFASFLKISDASKQAFSKARKNLSPKVFQLLNQKLVAEFYSENTFKTFKGFRILAIDGSTVRLPKSEELYKEFGTHTKAGSVPLATTSVLYDVLNHITLDAVLYPFRASERSMAMDHFKTMLNLDKLTKNNDVIVFDRGYPSLFLIFYLLHIQKHFVIRIYDHFINEINDVIKGGMNDTILTIPAFKKERSISKDFKQYLPDLDKNAVATIRVLIFDLSSGEKEIIVTSLIDQQEFPATEIFALYAKRWNVEEHYKLYKCIASIENFSGESKLAIEQDFHATVFTCNAASLLAQEAQEELESMQPKENRKYTYQINRNILVGTIKNEILEVLLGNNNLEEYCEQLKQRLKRSLVAIRPGRSYPRPYRTRLWKPIRDKSCL
jgi:Transposase DDE domain